MVAAPQYLGQLHSIFHLKFSTWRHQGLKVGPFACNKCSPTERFMKPFQSYCQTSLIFVTGFPNHHIKPFWCVDIAHGIVHAQRFGACNITCTSSKRASARESTGKRISRHGRLINSLCIAHFFFLQPFPPKLHHKRNSQK